MCHAPPALPRTVPVGGHFVPFFVLMLVGLFAFLYPFPSVSLLVLVLAFKFSSPLCLSLLFVFLSQILGLVMESASDSPSSSSAYRRIH
jgi:hypothetical protein